MFDWFSNSEKKVISLFSNITWISGEEKKIVDFLNNLPAKIESFETTIKNITEDVQEVIAEVQNLKNLINKPN